MTPLDFAVRRKAPRADKAGGGGRANNRRPDSTSRGGSKFKWTQFTPPQAKIENQNPKLAMDPSLLGPPDLKVPSPNMANFGDPLGKASRILSEMAMAQVSAAARAASLGLVKAAARAAESFARA